MRSGITHVRVIGTGLIGTSLGIALSAKGFRISLEDPSPTACRLARDLGAGQLAAQFDPEDEPDIVVVAAYNTELYDGLRLHQNENTGGCSPRRRHRT